jgi:hypothetical protein
MKLSERDIERTCTDFLALDGWRALKTDPVSRREWGKGFGEKGMADHIYIRYALGRRLSILGASETLWIEWKRYGGKVAQHQREWHLLERRRGALTLIAGEDFPATIEGFQSWYRSSGLMRRKV